jgi:phosphoserine aminotransferase
MARVHNFSAGPGVLPESVVQQTQEALWELEGCGQGLMETSHRGKAFDDVIVRARTRLARLLGVGDDYEVLFLHGGARTQFFQIPMNFLRGGRATYLDTGTWAYQAAEEARRYGTVDVPWSSRASRYDRVPRQGDWAQAADTRYLHYTSNNTVAGTEYDYVPDPQGAWLVCDASSDILSRPMDGSKFDLIYAGAQKNLGPAGVTLVVLRKALLEHADEDLPAMCRYGLHVNKRSLYNTPTTFAIYVVERVTAWIEEQGGVAGIDARNERQASALYGTIDGSGFWRGLAETGSRSRMNVTFTTGDADLDTRFVAEAADAGLVGLKGHRSVGGLRASIYNAQTDAAVDALVAFMGDFERRNG